MRKYFYLIFFILLLLAIPARATTVTVNAQSIAGFQPSGIGSNVALTLSVTSSSTAVTCSSCLRTQWVGLGGFRLAIAGVDYTVSSIDSTSSLTLTSNYLGSTSAAASSTLYKYVEIRLYSNIAFIPLGSASIVQAGSPGSGAFFKRFAAGVVVSGATSTLYIPSFTVDSTTDSVDNQTARYTIGIYRPAAGDAAGASLIQYYACSANMVQLRIPPTTPTTLGAICIFNSTIVQNADQTAYTKGQIDARFPNCADGQVWIFLSNALTCGSASSIGGATIALDNLASVNINSSLLAQTGIDLGSTTKPFRDLYLFGSGTYGTNYFRFTGTPTAGRTVTWPDLTGIPALTTGAQTLSSKTLDNSNSFSGYFDATRITAPSNPASGSLRLFANNSTGKLACLDSAGADCMPNSGAAGATTALDNLASVNINTSLLAQASVDLGSTTKPFRNLYVYGSGTYGTNYFQITGTPTAARTHTLPDLASSTFAVIAGVQTFSNKVLDNSNSFSGYFDATRITAPSNPASGSLRLFANNSTGKLACLDNSGVDCMPSASAAMAIGGTVTSGTTGSILFVGAGPVLAQNNSGLFFDTGNVRLGLNTAIPLKTLDVRGSNASNNAIAAFRNTATDGFSGFDFLKSDGTYQGTMGYGNASATSAFAGKMFIRVWNDSLVILTNADSLAMTVAQSGNPAVAIQNAAADGVALTANATTNGAIPLKLIATTVGMVAAALQYDYTANTNSRQDLVVTNYNYFSTPANGFGANYNFNLQTTTTSNRNAVRLGFIWKNATDASRTGSFVVDTVDNAGSIAERFRVEGNGADTGTILTQSGVNGAQKLHGMISQNVTLSTSGTTTDSTIDLPANSIILSVTARITTTITTATDWKMGDPTISDRFSDANATLTAGTTSVGINQWKSDRVTAGQGAFQQAAAKVRITTTGTPGAGAIRITINYIQLVPPTS